MSQIQGGFSITALMDGTTINGFVRVENMPLAQRYTKGSDKFTPDFETVPENNRPVVVAINRDITDGSVLTPQTAVFKYNGLELTFGPDGLCTSEGYEGVFKKLTDYPAQVGGASYPMIAMRVMKNLVPLSGYDNDRISVSGTVEIGGQSIQFSEMSTDVVIQETTGNQFDVVITNDKGSALTAPGESLTERADVYRDGVKVGDLSSFTFQWVKVTADGEQNLGTAQTQVISTDDVDNVLKVRCDVSQEGTIIASKYDEVSDFSDPYYVQFNITGVEGSSIRKGQTAVITPVPVKRSSGEVNETLVTSWTFYTRDNQGKDFTLTGKDSAKFTDKSCSISFADTKRAGMCVNGYVSANF